jgi:hypothetical protein
MCCLHLQGTFAIKNVETLRSFEKFASTYQISQWHISEGSNQHRQILFLYTIPYLEHITTLNFLKYPSKNIQLTEFRKIAPTSVKCFIYQGRQMVPRNQTLHSPICSITCRVISNARARWYDPCRTGGIVGRHAGVVRSTPGNPRFKNRPV